MKKFRSLIISLLVMSLSLSTVPVFAEDTGNTDEITTMAVCEEGEHVFNGRSDTECDVCGAPTAPDMNEVSVSVPTNHISIPAEGAEPTTLQPEIKILDQFGNDFVPTTLTWYLRDSLDSEETYTELNGVSIDPETGLITVPADATVCEMYAGARATSQYVDMNGKNRSASGSSHKKLFIEVTEEEDEEEEDDRRLFSLTIHLENNHISIPEEGEESNTLQPTYTLIDQYGDPIDCDTMTWTLVKNIGDDDEYQTLNGITVDADTGLVTVPSDAEDCKIYIHALAYALHDAETGRHSYSSNFQQLIIGNGGETPPSEEDPFLYGVDIKLDKNSATIPDKGEDALTIQPAYSVYDQNKQPYEKDLSFTWSLRESPSGEGLTELNGVTIDPDTGLITIPDTAEAGKIYIHLYVQEGTSESYTDTYTYYGFNLNAAEVTPDPPADTPEPPAETSVDINGLDGSNISGTCVITGEEELSVKVNLKNNGSTSEELTVFLAEYDKNGKMIFLSSDALTIAASGSASAIFTAEEQDAATIRIFAVDESMTPLTEQTELSVPDLRYKAWYEVDKDGQLTLKTNIDSSKWGGYSMLVINHMTNRNNPNHYECDTNYGRGIVTFPSGSMLSYSWSDEVSGVKSTDIYVFKGNTSLDAFWDLKKDYETPHEAVSALPETFVYHATLDNQVAFSSTDSPIVFTDFDITYDTAKQKETYTAVLESEIFDIGEYGLTYSRESGDRNAGMSYIDRGDGVLTFTREMNHFADAGSGASGTFYITYVVYSMDSDGSITCTKAQSNGIHYTFN